MRALFKSIFYVGCAAFWGLVLPADAKEVPSSNSVCVKYGPCPLDLTSFNCVDTPRSSFVRRVCYDAPKSFMAINLGGTWYPYCMIDPGTVHAFLQSESVGSFYNQNIRSKRDGSRGPFDCRDHPIPSYR